MRLNKAEIAFIVGLLSLLAAGGALYSAYAALAGHISLGPPEAVAVHLGVQRRLLAAGTIMAATIAFGILFIFPLLRAQVREQGQLKQMTAKLSARSVTLEQAALTDGLTGMNNRRYFDDALREYLKEFSRIDRPVGLMILDLDHFKSVNDTHGHDVGDEVLRAVAKCLKDFTRYHDIVARLGGEEFAVVAPNLDQATLEKLADRIRRAVANLVIQSGNVSLKVTTSVGLAVWDHKESADDFCKRADRMLYKAKRDGRNRVCA